MIENYTPGPWGITTERNSECVQPWLYQKAKGGGVQRTVFDGEAIEEFPLSGDDARLIAAAPELLAACEALVKAYGEGKERGGSIDWSSLDVAHRLARQALGLKDGEA